MSATPAPSDPTGCAPLAAEAASTANTTAEDLRHFRAIADLARDEAGLALPPAKAPMVLSRVAKRMRATGHATLAEYCADLARSDGAAERHALVDTLTTNVTSFFRETHHFEALRTEILPDLVAHARAGARLRLWSAGCSTGEEPYSIAMILLEAMPDAAERDIRILATDIDRSVLAAAAQGRYPAQAVAPLSQARRERFLVADTQAADGARAYRVSDALRRLVVVRPLNLVGPWPMRGRFQAIFCRNVVIYFDREAQAALWPRFAATLVPGGHLFVGHSERVDDPAACGLRLAGPTIYRRLADGPLP